MTRQQTNLVGNLLSFQPFGIGKPFEIERLTGVQGERKAGIFESR